MKAIKPEDQEKVDALMEGIKISQSGYGGVMPNGNIVDRRKHPEATPIQENSLFDVPKPIKLNANNQKEKAKWHTWIPLARKSDKRCAKCGIYRLTRHISGQRRPRHYYSTDGHDDIGITYDCK